MTKYEWKKEWWTSHGKLSERPETILDLDECDIEDYECSKTLSEWNDPKTMFAAISVDDKNAVGCMEFDAATGEDVWVEICLVKYHLVDDDESVDLDHIYVTPQGRWYCPDDKSLMPPKKYQNEFNKFMKGSE